MDGDGNGDDEGDSANGLVDETDADDTQVNTTAAEGYDEGGSGGDQIEIDGDMEDNGVETEDEVGTTDEDGADESGIKEGDEGNEPDEDGAEENNAVGGDEGDLDDATVEPGTSTPLISSSFSLGVSCPGNLILITTLAMQLVFVRLL